MHVVSVPPSLPTALKVNVKIASAGMPVLLGILIRLVIAASAGLPGFPEEYASVVSVVPSIIIAASALYENSFTIDLSFMSIIPFLDFFDLSGFLFLICSLLMVDLSLMLLVVYLT